MHALTYRCPKCKTTVDVTEDMLHETIVCPNEECRTPFDLEVPRGEFVGSTPMDGDKEVNENLLNESTVQEERTLMSVHPAMFRQDPLWFTLYIILAAGGLYGSFTWWMSDGTTILSAIAFFVALFALAMLFKWWLQCIYTTLSITSRRSVLRFGILSKRSTEVRHDDVRNLQIEQSMMERLFGVGDIAISSAGQDELEIHAIGIPQPEKIAQKIRELQGD